MTAAASEQHSRWRFDWSEPGTVVSAAAHVALLVGLLVSFSNTAKLDDSQESIPVESVTSAQFNEIMKGEKTAKAMAQPQTKVDKVAPVEVRRQSEPTPNAKVDIPTPLAPLKRTQDPGEDTTPAEAPPKAAALPPPPPPEPVAPPKVEPKPPTPVAPKVETEPPPKDDPDAEISKPVARPVPKKEAEKPVPKPPEKPVEKPHHVAKKPAPKTDPKTKTDPKSKTDKVAKLLEEKKLEEIAAADPTPKPEKPHKRHSKPKSGTEATEPPDRKFNPNDIAKLLSKEAPQSTGSTGRKASKVASLGTATSNAPRLSPFFAETLGNLIISEYAKCWRHQFEYEGYVPRFDIHYSADWTLIGRPVLINQPSTAKDKALADSALRAITGPGCNPLKIPDSYSKYYEDWKHKVIDFDPRLKDSAG